MQVFNTFFKITKKQLGSCIMYFVIFIGLISMLTGLGSRQREGFEDYSESIVIFDRDNSVVSQKLVEYLGTIHKIQEMDEDENKLLDYLYYQKIDYILYIEDGYMTSGELTNVKRPGSNTGLYIDNQIASYEKSMSALMESGYSTDESYDITIEALNKEGLVSFASDNVSKSNMYYYYVYIPYIYIMILFNTLAPVLIAFGRREISDRTNVSPISHKSKSLQLIMGSVLLSISMMAIFVAFSIVMCHNDINMMTDKFLYSVLNAFIFMLVSVGLVTIVGNFNIGAQAISAISNIVGLGFSFLGGIFVPMEMFSDGLINISKFLPTYWYVLAQDNIFSEGRVEDLYKYLGIELLFALVFFSVSLVISKRMKLRRA